MAHILDEEENVSLTRRLLSLLTAVAATLGLVTAGIADAHGSTTDPPSRSYGCWQRWGSDHQNPDMGLTDPMCAQAWKADPDAMWIWRGVYRNGLGGDFRGAIPDGQLCSGGNAANGRYRSLDAVGDWVMADKPRRFDLTIDDQAKHGADFLRVHITRQGFDAATRPLGWGDLELVTSTGRYEPSGVYTTQVDAGSRSGRHVVFVIWQASHMDQAYFLCSDVNFR
ncbi:chitin-binding protein [Saccharothrix coeruleofusca]|uniref:Chitin-binding protein n=1 Tax=Saccharothrix coeruleofusca TaxID=33919 RepID=A0A918AW97_9PSEU|nr:chitin-binding protein [Saccharothrix coeruleofusca]